MASSKEDVDEHDDGGNDDDVDDVDDGGGDDGDDDVDDDDDEEEEEEDESWWSANIDNSHCSMFAIFEPGNQPNVVVKRVDGRGGWFSGTWLFALDWVE